MPESLEQRLGDGLRHIDLQLSLQQQQDLVDYVQLMMKWNKAFNLSAIRDPFEAIDKHIIDSLTILPLLENYSQFLDVGAGAGLPGIPLAIARPDSVITLVDSNGKKTRFMQQCVAELGLTNVTVIQSRIEQLPTTIEFEVVMARALATMSQMLNWLAPLMTPTRQLLAMKGVFPEQELSEIPKAYKVSAVKTLISPRNASSRHAVFVQTNTV